MPINICRCLSVPVDTCRHISTHTHTQIDRYISTHIDRYRYISTLIDTHPYISTHTDAHQYTASHNDTYRYISTHIDTYRHSSTNIDSYSGLATTCTYRCIPIHVDTCLSVHDGADLYISLPQHSQEPKKRRSRQGSIRRTGPERKESGLCTSIVIPVGPEAAIGCRICIKVPGRYVQKSSHTPTRYCQRSTDRELAQLTVAWDGCHPWVCQNRGWTGADNIDTYRHIRTTIRTWGLHILIAVASYR